MTAIAFENVTLKLGARTIVSGVDLAIGAGEFVGLLGPNGAGKTTLLRAILGLLQPSAGAIRLFGAAPLKGDRRIGYMPQHRVAAATRSLTGWDYVASAAGGWRWGLPRLSAAERDEVGWALETVGAADLARRPLMALSGGERQRLLISQALLGRPKLLLLDEPLISLDPSRQQSTVDLVKRLQAEFGMTVLFSAHELNPLLGAMDRVLYLGNGHAMLGTVDEVVTGPSLSRLYGAPIEVLRLGRRLFVVSGDIEVEAGAHRHDACAHHDHAGHGAAEHHHA
ncbi:ATP-binding cassette domain-containing protein [Lichenihabitans sp. Uapishka_5]|uniref:metal ABC transporter ATP-binding protein n=1 Tax=Lichenihabitans sp. Uapishka_5 TaxID=3037302 RepID=UPI0029E7F74A|nr:ATP-binding cassette domain-containing protein [Lichenihabitans sp. Uapishka_5]MDX7949593.1 ATP-binding cassette domain-containing protein [Lichenihabitans sp. Uapishka_5]